LNACSSGSSLLRGATPPGESELLAKLRIANLVITAFGAGVFAALLAYVSLASEDFDRRTREFAIGLVQSRTETTLREIAHSDRTESIAAFAGVFSKRLENDIKEFQESIDAGVPQLIADMLAAACRLDCDRKEAAEQSIMRIYGAVIDRYGTALERARLLVINEYDRAMAELRGDLQIFAGSTLVAFLGALALAIFKGRAAAHLIPISIALSLATALAVLWYVFGQDWVMTVIFSDYWGWSYAAIIATIWTLLADIAVNKARITTSILNGVGDIFGSIPLSPC